jgi:integrase
MGLLIREYEVDHRSIWPALPLHAIPGISTPAVKPVVGPTFRAAAEQYYREVIEARRTPLSAKNTKSLISYHLLPAFGEKPLAEIKKGDIRALFRQIGTTRTVPYRGRLGGCQNRANTAYWFLRGLFFWSADPDEGAGFIDHSPMFGIKQPYPVHERERYLSDAEIRWFWAATSGLSYPYGSVAKLLLLTGARRGEITNLTMRQIDRPGRMLTIPIPADKSRRGHLVPLSDLAIDVLGEIPRLTGRVALFGRDGVKPPNSGNFYQANRRLNRRMRQLCRAEVAAAGGDLDDAEVPYLTYHDLRRTSATLMARLGQPLEVVDRIMNHANGRSGTGRTINSTTRVYVRHEYLDERRVALQALADHIKKLVGI